MTDIKNARDYNSAIFAFPVVLTLLCDLGWHGGVLKDMKNGPFPQDFWRFSIMYFIKNSTECSNSCVFSRLDFFLEVPGQFKEWLIFTIIFVFLSFR